MSSSIFIGCIYGSSADDDVGIFSGQNIQNDWDSHAPSMSSLGYVLGNNCVVSSDFAYLWNNCEIGQPIYDQDEKFNGSTSDIGP